MKWPIYSPLKTKVTKGANLIYTITVGCITYMQNLGFKFKFGLCVMYPMVKVYTLSVYRILILTKIPFWWERLLL